VRHLSGGQARRFSVVAALKTRYWQILDDVAHLRFPLERIADG
jgi:hypothetical protein